MATIDNINKGKTIKDKVVVKAGLAGIKPAIKKDESKPETSKPEIKLVTKQDEQKKSSLPAGKIVTFDRKELEPVLSIVKDFTEKKATMPVLLHVHMKTEQDTIKFTATDIDRSWTGSIPGKGNPIDVCIPLDIFIREVKALHSDIKEVELMFTDNTVKVNGRCEIFILPGEDFPSLPNVGSRKIDIPGFTDKIARLLPAAGEGDSRYILNAILIDLEHGYIVATDGHRMHFDRISAQKDAGQFIISRESASMIVKHKAANTMQMSKKHITFTIAGGTMMSRRIEGTYPKYENVIPQDNTIKVMFQGPDFLKVLEGALPVVADRGNTIRMSVNGKIDIETDNPGIGNYKWHVPCSSAGTAKNFTVGFNAKYLIDAIKAFTSKEDSKVTMTFKDPMSPCLINDRAVVMPMRT